MTAAGSVYQTTVARRNVWKVLVFHIDDFHAVAYDLGMHVLVRQQVLLRYHIIYGPGCVLGLNQLIESGLLPEAFAEVDHSRL